MMSKKIKLLVFSTFAFCALFVTNIDSYAQDDSESQNEQLSTQNEDLLTKDDKDDYKDEYNDETDENTPDEYVDEDYVYMQNGPGDQYINFRIMPNFPFNFNGTLKVGGQIGLSYNRFLTSWFALGAELVFGYNATIGGNILTYVPLTLGVTFLPTVQKFEFPITFNVGAAVENYLNNTYFPGLVLRGGAGCYYRITESWSAGIEGFFTYMPQWYKDDSDKNNYLNLASASIGIKYHF